MKKIQCIALEGRYFIPCLDSFIENGEEFIIMMLEDYWLMQPVDHVAIKLLTDYMREHSDKLLRIDLTSDRCQHRRYTVHTLKIGEYELIQTSADSPYQMSFQAGIWNLRLMQEVLNPYENPWQAEINGSKRLALAGDRYTVFGTRNCPVRYQPVYRSHRASVDISKLPKEDHDTILKRGWV